ncbi:MAG TPA: FAD-binding protein [Vicinamibacterales bacterium]|nr:FAD-binding protein [Vicinamibacterales bacterium]
MVGYVTIDDRPAAGKEGFVVLMNKRAFLKLSSAWLATPVLSGLGGRAQREALRNWAGNLTYSTGEIHTPGSVEEIQQLVRKHRRLKVLGTRHCFNTIADSRDAFVSLARLNSLVRLDPTASEVTIEAGMSYGQLCPLIDARGFALHNLASLPHISVAGACATATHGSGIKNGNLATAVTAIEMVTADGEVATLTRSNDGERFQAAVVGLGALGVVTRLTLRVQPRYQMRQYVYEQLPLAEVQEHFEPIFSAGYSVSLFTDWQSDRVNSVWIKSREGSGAERSPTEPFFGARPATRHLHPIVELSAENCTEQMGVPGPWYERLPHFRMGFTPSSGKELQAEYFVPRRHAVDAFLAVSRIGRRFSREILISEIRAIDADDLWMSPCYKEPCVAIHFTWKQDWPAVAARMQVIEQELAPFQARPHWGKLFTISPALLRSRYEKLADFRKQIAIYDPQGKFRNEFLQKHLYDPDA